MRFKLYRSALCLITLVCLLSLAACASGTPHQGDLPLPPPSQPTSVPGQTSNASGAVPMTPALEENR